MKTKLIPISFLAAIVLLVGCSRDVTTVNIEKESIEHLIDEYDDCQSSAENALSCKDFTAKAISKYYGVEDLMVEGKYINYDEIYDFVDGSDAWRNYGKASRQVVLDNAQKFANEGVPVIAINTSDDNKFVVLIIEGEQSKSSKWGVNVPNCAAFFPKNGPEPFINKTLNYAWSSPDGVEIWVRN
ncbi:MAG: hypothetical protein KDD41_09175 [Flavobacteriales bacterium]|nr:hypothetical protein [Flavobacteriales bacterium]